MVEIYRITCGRSRIDLLMFSSALGPRMLKSGVFDPACPVVSGAEYQSLLLVMMASGLSSRSYLYFMEGKDICAQLETDEKSGPVATLHLEGGDGDLLRMWAAELNRKQ
jgi:hypothetical protein